MKLLLILFVFSLQIFINVYSQSCEETIDRFTGQRIVFSKMNIGMNAVLAITNSPEDTVMLYRYQQRTYLPDFSRPAIILLGDNSKFETEMTERGTVIGLDGRGEWVAVKLNRQMLFAIATKGVKGIRFSVPGGFEVAEIGLPDKTKKMALCMLNK